MAATAGAIALTVALPAVSAQAYTVGDYYKVVNLSSGFCIDANSGYNSSVGIDPCHQGTTSQKWLLESTSDSGYYKFHNQAVGGCLDEAEGYYLGDDLCVSGSTTERFALQSTSQSGYYKLVDQSTGQCVYYSEGSAYFQACAQGADDQKFELQATN